MSATLAAMRDALACVGVEMAMNPESLKAESAVVRADAPRQGKPVCRGELPERARRAYSARARKREAEATRVTAATDANANAGRENCVSWQGSCGGVRLPAR
jgi:hypothetical protein